MVRSVNSKVEISPLAALTVAQGQVTLCILVSTLGSHLHCPCPWFGGTFKLRPPTKHLVSGFFGTMEGAKMEPVRPT